MTTAMWLWLCPKCGKWRAKAIGKEGSKVRCHACGEEAFVKRDSEYVKPRMVDVPITLLGVRVRHFTLPDIVEVRVEIREGNMKVYGRQPGDESWYEMEPGLHG